MILALVLVVARAQWGSGRPGARITLQGNTPSRSKILGKSKIADFEMALGVEEQVLRL